MDREYQQHHPALEVVPVQNHKVGIEGHNNGLQYVTSLCVVDHVLTCICFAAAAPPAAAPPAATSDYFN